MDDEVRQETKNSENEKIPDEQDVIDSMQGVDAMLSESKTEAKLKKHLQIINEQLEKAKDPATYETYNFTESTADKRIKLFTVRKKGTKHVLEKTPCQDYCLATSVNGCTILADADGVSSCEYSDVGSKLACDAVVKTVEIASKSCSDENTLVSRLLSVSFREKLVSMWIKLVMEEVNKTRSLSSSDQLKEFSKYGSTIMFAIITENWIVVGNLGDGQILVFNDYYGIKLRVHAPKESSKVRCLANERCAREDFQVEKYPRSLFNGVLLSTDGMYESLDKGNHFYNYAIQMKRRFFDRLSPEPYQAFCYKEVGEPYKDFSAMRTQDDCSVVLAVENSDLDIDYLKVKQSILNNSQACLLRRQSSDCMSFYAKYDDGYVDVVVTPLQSEFEKLILNTAEVEKAIKTWRDEKYSYAIYRVSQAYTLEFMQSSGMLRVDKYKTYESEQMILSIFVKMNELKKELSKNDLELNSSAMYNVSFDGARLYVKKEALSKSIGQKNKAYTETMDKCFSHLLGVLECSGNRQPVFDIGYIDRGRKYYMLGDYSDNEFAQLVRDTRTIRIKNISMFKWLLDDGSFIHTGESLDLTSHISFCVLDDENNKIQEYIYTPKENL